MAAIGANGVGVNGEDNFVITYELLDEMMDNGYPQTTEACVDVRDQCSMSGQKAVDGQVVPVKQQTQLPGVQDDRNSNLWALGIGRSRFCESTSRLNRISWRPRVAD